MNKRLTICLLVKWCEHRFLMEWISHHFKLGADRFIIICDDLETYYISQVLNYFKKLVEIKLLSKDCFPNQMQADMYKWAANTNHDSKTICFLDDDEFIIPTEGFDFLAWVDKVHESQKPHLIDRVEFGDSFYEVNPPSQLGHLVYRSPVMLRFPKWICNPTVVTECPAHFPPGPCYDANGVLHDAANSRTSTADLEMFPDKDPWFDTPLRINHYAARSIMDLHHRVMKGTITGRYPSWHLVSLRRGLAPAMNWVEDRSASRFYDVAEHHRFLDHLAGIPTKPRPTGDVTLHSRG